MIQVNNEWFYEDLDEENIKIVLDHLRDEKEITPGPQIAERTNSEGKLGRTCLETMPDSVFTRDFAAAKEEWAAAKAEKK